ncbi:UvrD-helicase domain-containing protein [Vibrio harveyi]
MNWQFHLRKIIKFLNLTRRSKRKLTAYRFKEHYRIQGFSKGYNTAKEELTSVIEHTYAEEPYFEEIHVDHVVPPQIIKFKREDAEAFYRRVFGKLPKDRRPNNEQRNLIFSKARNTLAVAGAGSGKTTSLINRLLFLHQVCHVPLEQLTVFSFTRASVADFRKKLIEVFGANGVEVTPEKSEQVIRTFHSKVLEMSRDSFLKGQFKIFEFLTDKVDIDHESEDDELRYRTALKKANEEVVAVSELNFAQSTLLYNTLDRCYRENQKFREKLDSLFLLKLELKFGGSAPSMAAGIIQKTNDFEQLLTPLMSGFFELNDEAQPGRQLDLSRSEYSQLVISSDAYYPAHDVHVIYAPNNKLLKTKNLNKQLEVKGFTQQVNALVKRKAFIGVNYATDKVYVLSEQQDVIALDIYLNNLNIQQSKTNKKLVCPRFSAKFDGDFAFKPITDVFFEIATFAESIGVKPEHAAVYIQKTNMSKTDKLLLEAVGPFWKAFDRVLADSDTIRFNNMFQTFSTPHNQAFKSLSPKMKNSLKNIIIDEFQDISPEVAKWIQATLRTLTQENIRTSLMCVGDDFQSIYGWRGSSPEFLSNYGAKFPAKDIAIVFMNQNYRSFQSIVDTAESCLKYTKDFEKTGKCMLNDNHARLSFYQPKFTKDNNENITIGSAKELLADIQKALVEEDKIEKDTDLLVMAKTNAVLNELKGTFHQARTQSGKRIKVEFQTFHRSKGLEARYCLLVEDCDYDNQHPTKNYLYKLAGFEKTFDESQTEEAMRLAYVAVTRAKERVWWITHENADGSFVVARNYAERNNFINNNPPSRALSAH